MVFVLRTKGCKFLSTPFPFPFPFELGRWFSVRPSEKLQPRGKRFDMVSVANLRLCGDLLATPPSLLIIRPSLKFQPTVRLDLLPVTTLLLLGPVRPFALIISPSLKVQPIARPALLLVTVLSLLGPVRRFAVIISPSLKVQVTLRSDLDLVTKSPSFAELPAPFLMTMPSLKLQTTERFDSDFTMISPLLMGADFAMSFASGSVLRLRPSWNVQAMGRRFELASVSVPLLLSGDLWAPLTNS